MVMFFVRVFSNRINQLLITNSCILVYQLLLLYKRNISFNIVFLKENFFLYPPKRSENLCFSDVFRGYKKGTPISNELNKWAIIVSINDQILQHLIDTITR